MKALFKFVEWPLRVRLAALFVGVATLPVLLIAGLEQHEARTRLRQELRARLQDRAEQAAQQFDALHARNRQLAATLLRQAGIAAYCHASVADRTALEARARAALEAQTAGDAQVVQAALLDPDGRLAIAADTSWSGAALATAWDLPLALHAASEGRATVGRIASPSTLLYFTPLVDADGRVGCVALLAVPTAAYEAILRGASRWPARPGRAFLLDERGSPILSTAEPTGPTPATPATPSTDIAELAELAQPADTANALRAEQRLAGVPWRIAVSLPRAAFDAELARQAHRRWFLAGVATLFAGALGGGAARYLSAPWSALLATLASRQLQLDRELAQAGDERRQVHRTALQQGSLHAIGQMAAGIAHDINNAIAPAALYAEALLERETQVSDRGREHLRTISQAIEDVASTLARMDEFHRHHHLPHASGVVRLNQLVPQVLALTRARWRDMPQRRGVVIELRSELAHDLPPVRGVAGELRQALTNLVLNAVDAMPRGGVLTVRTHDGARRAGPGIDHRGVRACLDVHDDGLGMDAETRRRCTEPFFTTKGRDGTGLGLAMVHTTMRRHRGSLEIDSTPGRGTTVHLSFEGMAVPPSNAPEAFEATPSARALNLLVIDDDAGLRRCLRDALECDGHAVVTAAGGSEGVRTFSAELRGRPFDLVITDLGMPRMDGHRVTGLIKRLAPLTPVILLTGWSTRPPSALRRDDHEEDNDNDNDDDDDNDNDFDVDFDIDHGDADDAGPPAGPGIADLVLTKPVRLQDLRVALARLDPARREQPPARSRATA